MTNMSISLLTLGGEDGAEVQVLGHVLFHRVSAVTSTSAQ